MDKETVKTNMGEIPLEDYLDIIAMQLGFNDYYDLKTQGLTLASFTTE